MLVWRLGTAAHPIWDGAGAARYGGRWNPPGMPAIYAASSLSLAMLERLVQQNNLARTSLVEAIVPDNIEVTDLMTDPPANWRALDSPEAMRAGGEWLARHGTALLRVPSAIVPREANYVINPAHPDAIGIQVMPPDPLFWDARLFGVPAPA
ncbi:MAG TPA: RES domain-containing protein [Acetobacteraceae bacterium]|jgi:RES domain-containing protein